MSSHVVRTAVALALLLTTLFGCSEDQSVTKGPPPAPRTTPSPSVPTKTSLLRYVSPHGSDSNPGTIEQPWRTLAYALHRIYSPQVLFVRGGRYHENISHLQIHTGSADAPITALAYPGENPVLVGSVSLRRPTYWLIDNLDVMGDPRATDPPPLMVKVTGGRSWTWENSEFTDTTGRANVMIVGWGVDEPAGFTFAGNCLHGLPDPPATSTNLVLGAMEPGAHGTVARNVVFNSEGQTNVRIGSGAGAPRAVKIIGNTIYGGSLGIDVRGRPHRIRISRNVLGGSDAPAMIRFHLGLPQGTTVNNNLTVEAARLLRPEVRKIVHGSGNISLSGDPEFVDTTQCDGFRSSRDALIPYGAEAP